MRKLNLLLLRLLLVLSLTNCPNDDNNDSGKPTLSVLQKKLIGTWYSEEGATYKMTLNFPPSGNVTFIEFYDNESI